MPDGLRWCFASAAFILTACGAESPPESAGSNSMTAVVTAEPLRALGTEPFWALDVDSAGLRFITPDDTIGIRFPPIAPTSVGDTLIWAGQTERASIEARIWREKCSDGMSDREYLYTARVTVAGTTHRGCADRLRVIVPRS